MKADYSKFPLLKLPSGVEHTLFLIKEELKSYKFFNILRKTGLTDCYYQPHLGELILAYIGFDNDANETFDFYYSLIEKHSKQLEPDQEVIMRETLIVYHELINEKKRRGVVKMKG
jgi:hypothetical protein